MAQKQTAYSDYPITDIVSKQNDDIDTVIVGMIILLKVDFL